MPTIPFVWTRKHQDATTCVSPDLNGLGIEPMPNAFVRKLTAYAPLSAGEMDLLTMASDAPRKVAAHRDLIREGEQPGQVFVVLDGWVCRYKVLRDGSRQIMAFMMPGDFCDVHTGSLEQLDHSVATLTACQIASIPSNKMEALIVATPRLTHAFWRAQMTDQGVMRAWIVSMGRRDALERVAHLMLELYVRMRNVGLATDHTCEIPLTQTMVADALGLTPVHTNRVLRILRERQIMTLGSGRLRINNSVDLARIAGFNERYLYQRIKKES